MNIDKLKELHKRDEIKILGKEYIICAISPIVDKKGTDYDNIGTVYDLNDNSDKFGIEATHHLRIEEYPKLKITLSKIKHDQVEGIIINFTHKIKSMMKLGFMQKDDKIELQDKDIAIK